MATRKEKKEQLRRERREREAAEKRAAERRRRLMTVATVLFAVAALAAIGIAITVASGGSDEDGGAGDMADVAIPKAKVTDLETAAKAADCTLQDYPDFGAQHTEKPVKYRTNPPTSGPHFPVPASDRIYGRGETPPPGKLVHALEHGRIEIQYKPGTSPRLIGQLQSLYKEPFGEAPGGTFTLLFENETGMRPAVVATAWRHALECPTPNDRMFDAIRAFRTAYFLKGPEVITQPE